MTLLKRSPHYLVRNQYSYCFRAYVPKDLQELLGKKELRYTLKTGYVGVARVNAQIIAAQVHQIFIGLRKGGGRLAELTDEKIQELVNQYLKEFIKRLETRYYEEDPRGTIQSTDDFYRYLGELDSIKDDIIEYLGIGSYETIEPAVGDLLQRNGIQGIEKNSSAYIKLCRGVLRAELKGIEIEKQQMSTGFVDISESPIREQTPPALPTAPQEVKGPLLSEVIDRYAEEAESNWTPKTKDETLSSLRLFMEVVGDIPITSITRQRIGEFKQTLLKLPPNIKKNPEYRNKSIPDILKADIPKKMSPTTVRKHLTRVSALFEYAHRNGLYEAANPATGMNPKKSRRSHEARAPFTREELLKLFRSEDYIKDTFKEPYQFWMP